MPANDSLIEEFPDVAPAPVSGIEEFPDDSPAPSHGGYFTEIAHGLTDWVPASVKTASTIGADNPLEFPGSRTAIDATLRRLGADVPPPESKPLYRVGEWMEKKLENAYPSVPKGERHIGHDVARGVGQVVSMVGPALGARAIGLGVRGAAVLATGLGSGLEFDDAFSRARQRGDDPDTALAKALGYTTASALIENRFGAGRILKKYFPDPAGAAKKLGAWGISKATAISLAVGFGEEGSQRFAQNWIVEGKPSLEGTVQEGAPGGIVQAIAELPATLLRAGGGRVRRAPIARPAVLAPPQAAPVVVETPVAPQPNWIQQNVDATLSSLKPEVLGRIESLAADRKTAAEIATITGLDLDAVRYARIGLRIPSQTISGVGVQQPNPDFDTWLKDYQSRTVRQQTPPATAPVPTLIDAEVSRQKLWENMQGREMDIPRDQWEQPASPHLKMVLGNNAPSWRDLNFQGVVTANPNPDGSYRVKLITRAAQEATATPTELRRRLGIEDLDSGLNALVESPTESIQLIEGGIKGGQLTKQGNVTAESLDALLDLKAGVISRDEFRARIKKAKDAPAIMDSPKYDFTWQDSLEILKARRKQSENDYAKQQAIIDRETKLQEQLKLYGSKPAPSPAAAPAPTPTPEATPEANIAERSGGEGGSQTPFRDLGPGHAKFDDGLRLLIDARSLTEERAEILRDVFRDTNDSYLGRFTIDARAMRSAGWARWTGEEGDNRKAWLKLKRGLADLTDTAKEGFWAEPGHEPIVVFAHEYAHVAEYLMLSNDDRDLVKEVYQKLKAEGRIVDFFREGMSGSDASAKYYAKNWQEFLSESFAEYVMSKKVPVESMRPILARLYDAFKAAIARVFQRGAKGETAMLEPLYEKMLRGGEISPDLPTGDGMASGGQPTGSVEEEVRGSGPIVTERHDIEDEALGRTIGPKERAAGSQFTRQQIESTGLKTKDGPAGQIHLLDEQFPSEAEGSKLLELTREIARNWQNLPDFGSNFLDSVREIAARQERLRKEGLPTAFSLELSRELAQVAQGEIRFMAQRLAALPRITDEGLLAEAYNIDAFLLAELNEGYGGGIVDKVMRRIVTAFRDFFQTKPDGTSEIDDVLKQYPQLEELVTRLELAQQQDQGSIVFRMAHGRLKPKKAATLKALLRSARVKEAVEEIIQQAKRNGVTEKPSKTKPLTPWDQLLHMVEPDTAELIHESIVTAVAEAEQRAGTKVFLSELSPEERAMVDAATYEPTPEQVEEGFNTPEFAPWRVIRDNLLEYSPVTEKLVEKVLRGDFSGTRFAKTGAPEIKPAKIDLMALARSPDEEVARVFNEYLDNLKAAMDVQNATTETKRRVASQIRNELETQLREARDTINTGLFAEPIVKGQPLTPEQSLRQVLNTKLFADPRLELGGMIARVANRGLVQRMLPTMRDLIEQVLQTPVKNQAELGTLFSERLVNEFQVSTEQADGFARTFMQAFSNKFGEARQRALKQALASLLPEDKARAETGKPGKKLWDKIERAVNAGALDDLDVLRSIIAERGGKTPTDDEINTLKALVEQEQAMRELSDAQKAKAAGNPVELDRLKRERLAITHDARIALQHRIEAMMKRWVRPVSLKHWFAGKDVTYNNAQAINEFLTSNILARGLAGVRQALDTLTMKLWYVPHRAFAYAWTRYQTDLEAGREPNLGQLFGDYGEALKEAWVARRAAANAKWRALQQAAVGSGLPKHIESLKSGMLAVDRLNLRADELAKQPDTLSQIKSVLLRLYGLQQFGYRVFGALDVAQGIPAEWQEIMHQLVTGMRQQGKSNAEIETEKAAMFGDMIADWSNALVDAKAVLESTGKEPTDGQASQAAWNLVRERAYAKMALLGLPSDDFKARNKFLRQFIAWNLPAKGVGGALISKPTRGIQEGFARLGFPAPFAVFGNAMSIGLNRSLTWSGLGLLPDAFGDDPGYRTSIDRIQRKAEAITGLGIGGTLAVLGGIGAIAIRLGWPKDKEEREEWDAKGIKPWTVEIPYGGGKALRVPFRIGPLAPMSGLLGMGGAIHNVQERKAKAQERLNKEAARLGVTPGKVAPIDAGDVAGAGLQAAWAMMTSGRTASGLLGVYSDFGDFNSAKFLASYTTPLIPLLPAYQELTRLAGININASQASYFDLLIPNPYSGARRVNVLGEDVATPSHIERIIETVTLGGGIADAGGKNPAAAHKTLILSDYRPPAISPAKGYNFDGELRPMTQAELQRYTVARGKAFKQELQSVDVTGLAPKEAKAVVQSAFQRANAAALESVGVSRPASATSQPSYYDRTRQSPRAVGASLYRSSTPSARPVSFGRSRTRRRASLRSYPTRGRSRIRRPRLTRLSRPRVRRTRLYTSRTRRPRISRV